MLGGMSRRVVREPWPDRRRHGGNVPMAWCDGSWRTGVRVQRKLPWKPNELAELKAMIDAGRTIPEIARLVGRSQEATRARAAQNGWYAYPSRLFKGEPPTRSLKPSKYAVLYVSRSLIPTAEIAAVIADLVVAARQKNEKLGITGALVCTGTDFAQYLEGDESTVGSLIAQISDDPRHEDLIVLEAREVADARFGRWRLAYGGLSPLVSAIIDRARRLRHGNSERGNRDLITFLERFAARSES